MNCCASTPAQLLNFGSYDEIAKVVQGIVPFDNLERQHIKETLIWLESGVPIFRLQKPDMPPKHLCSYFLLLDEKARKVLLVDHKKADLWLPSGGHVEPDEHPHTTVTRECLEELGIEAKFRHESPLFLTSIITRGLTAGHTHVDLWYVLKGDQHAPCQFDIEEFRDIRWFSFDEIPYEISDPHMKRFIDKLKKTL